METLLYLLAVALILAGLVGIILPVMPGMLLVWGGLMVGAYADGYEHIGWFPCVVVTVIAVVSISADIVGTKYGTEKVSASQWATYGAILGSIVGLFFGPWGLLLGPFVGGALGELLYSKDHKQALKAGLGAWLGILISSAMKYVLAFSMIAVFVVSYIF